MSWMVMSAPAWLIWFGVIVVRQVRRGVLRSGMLGLVDCVCVLFWHGPAGMVICFQARQVDSLERIGSFFLWYGPAGEVFVWSVAARLSMDSPGEAGEARRVSVWRGSLMTGLEWPGVCVLLRHR